MLLVYIVILSITGNLVVNGEPSEPYGPWSDWTECSVDEGRGVMTRTRKCIVEDCPELGEYLDFMACFVKPCNCVCPPAPTVPETKAPTTVATGVINIGLHEETTTAASEVTTAAVSELPEETTTVATAVPTSAASTGVINIGLLEETTTTAPEITTTSAPEINTTSAPEISTSSAPEITTGAETTSAPEVNTTSASEITTGAETTSASEITTGAETTSAPEVNTTSAPEITTSSAPEITASSAPEITTGAETTSAPEINTTSAPEVTTTSAPEVNTTSAPEITTSSAPGVNTTSAPEITTTSAPEIPTSSTPEITTGAETTSAPEINTTSAPEITTSSAPEVTSTGAPEVNTTSAPEVNTTSEITTSTTGAETTSAPEISTSSAPEINTSTTGAETTSAPEVNTTSAPEITTSSAPEITTGAETTSAPEITTGAETTSAPEITTTSATSGEVTEPTEAATNGEIVEHIEPEIPCEENALGAKEGGALPSSSFTASSSYMEYVPSNGRLNGPWSWCSESDTAGQEFLQIHVPEAEMICGIAIQGNGYSEGDEYVKDYYLEYSDDGSRWQILEEDGNLKVFKGNEDSKSISKQVLPVPVEAKYVRIYPMQYEGWICMRVELYGKERKIQAPFPAFPEEEETTSAPIATEETTAAPPGQTTLAPITEEEFTPLGQLMTSAPTTTAPQCEPVGAAFGGSLPGSSFSASSEAGQDYVASNGRLNGPAAWCPDESSNAYLEIRLPSEMEICAIATQGFSVFNAWVTKYVVEISMDGQDWNQFVLDGNVNPHDPSIQRLPSIVTGQFIRIYPTESELFPCMKAEIFALTVPGPESELPTTVQEEVSSPPAPVTPPLPVTANEARRRGMDIGILIDSSFFVTADGFERLKSFVSDLIISINENFPNVHFGIIVYSDVPKLVMTLQNVDEVDVKSIIEGVKYIPGESAGDHRTDLAMLYASRKLFCPEGCEDRPEEENVMIVFTAENTDAESIPYSLVSPIMKNCSSNIIAVGISPEVSKSELFKIALGSPEHVLKVGWLENLDPDRRNRIMSKIEEIIAQGPVVPTTPGEVVEEEEQPTTGGLVHFRT